MANDLKVQDIIVREAMFFLKNNLVMGGLVNRSYENEFENSVNGYKKGSSVRIKRPENYIPAKSTTLSVADAEEATTTMVVDTQLNKGLQFTSQELTLMLSGPKGARRIGEEKIGPLMHSFANTIDLDLTRLYNKVYNYVGTPGTQIDSYPDYLKATERLNEMAVPMDRRSGILTPNDHVGLVGAFHNLYDTKVARSALEKARLPLLGGDDVYMSQNVATHTTGARGGTPLVNGGSQAVTYATAKATMTQTLITDGWTASAAPRVKAGDVFTIDGVYAVNPVGKQTLAFLQQFVVINDGSSDGSGNLTMTISPPIITSGAYQTVSAQPADNAPLNFLGTANTNYRQNMTFHKDAFALAVVPLELPDGAAFKARITEDGLSVRVTSGFDITNDTNIWRFDVLYGVKALRPELATRVNGTP